MSEEKKAWYQQKTTWTGVAGIVAALAGYFTDSMDSAVAIQAVLGSLALIFLRQGVEGGKGK